MAKTATTGFSFRKSIYGVDLPAAQDYILAGSATVKIGDLVRVNTTGYLVRCETTEAPSGVLIGITDRDGINVFSPRASGTTGATLTPDDQILTSSTNASDATRNLKGQVIVDPAGACLWFNDADGNFTQADVFVMMDVANGNQVTTGVKSDANGQVQLISIDPDGDGDLSKGLFRLSENQFGIGLDSATAKNAA